MAKGYVVYKRGEVRVFKTRLGAARFLGVSYVTLHRWGKFREGFDFVYAECVIE